MVVLLTDNRAADVNSPMKLTVKCSLIKLKH